MLSVPCSRGERLGEPLDDPLLDARCQQRPHRLRRADLRIEQGLGPAPEGLEEPVDAVAGRRNRLDPGLSAERVGDRVQRGKPRAFDLQAFGEMVSLPVRQSIELEAEDTTRSTSDATQLRQPGRQRLPVMDRHARHRRVDGVVVEWQLLGPCIDRGCHDLTGRWARIVALGSTAKTQRSSGS